MIKIKLKHMNYFHQNKLSKYMKNKWIWMKSNTHINQSKLVLMKYIHDTERCIHDNPKLKTYKTYVCIRICIKHISMYKLKHAHIN